MERSNELLCSHCNVHVLPPCRVGSKNAAILMVEKVFDSYAINAGLYSLAQYVISIYKYITDIRRFQ